MTAVGIVTCDESDGSGRNLGMPWKMKGAQKREAVVLAQSCIFVSNFSWKLINKEWVRGGKNSKRRVRVAHSKVWARIKKGGKIKNQSENKEKERRGNINREKLIEGKHVKRIEKVKEESKEITGWIKWEVTTEMWRKTIEISKNNLLRVN